MANSINLKDTEVRVGDTIKIHYAFNEKDKKKNQIFEGVVLGVRGREDNKTITVRKMTRSGIGVERIFPVISPFIEKVEVSKPTKATKADVTFIRTRSKRDIKDKLYQ